MNNVGFLPTNIWVERGIIPLPIQLFMERGQRFLFICDKGSVLGLEQ